MQKLKLDNLTWCVLKISILTSHLAMQILNQLIFDLFAAGQWFSPGTPVSSTNKTDRNDITEILLKVALNTTTLIPIFDLAPLARFK